MKHVASLRLFVLLISMTLFSAGCAGTPSAVRDDPAEPIREETAPEILAATDPDYDPSVNMLAHRGWAVSMPPGWRASVDYANRNSFLFRLSHDYVRMSVYPIEFGFEIESAKLLSYIEERLNSSGKAFRNKAIESQPLSRDCRLTAWDVEKGLGGLHRVILEENERGLFEWRISISEKREALYEDVVMRMFREAVLEENRAVSRRVQESGFEFSSQGGLWRWYGDLDQGFLLESLIGKSEPNTFLSVSSLESLMANNLETERWIETIKSKGPPVKKAISISGRPERREIWLQDEEGTERQALFFSGRDGDVLFYLDMRNREEPEGYLDAFIDGNSFRGLLDYGLKHPEAGI